jgi:apolipoprotein N-acyltransferase
VVVSFDSQRRAKPPASSLSSSAVILAALSGLLCCAALPPFDLWPLAFVCWMPLLVAIAQRTPKQALLLGAMQGFVINAGGSRWLPGVVATFGKMSPLTAVLLSLPLWVYGAGRSALLAWLTARARGRGPVGLTFVLALAASETFYPLLVPWYAAAQVHRVPLLMQGAELGGPILVGALLAASSAGLAEWVMARKERRAPNRGELAFAALAPALLVAYGAARIPAVDAAVASAPAGKIGLVQANVPHSGATLGRAIDVHRAATEKLVAQGDLDLVIWPETALSGVIPSEALGTVLRRDVASPPPGHPRITTPILTGALLKSDEELHNSALVFDGAGTVGGVYDKVRPLVVGEWLPFEQVFPRLRTWLPSAGQIAPGKSLAPLPLGPHRLSVLICYEDTLGAFANEMVREADPDLLVNLTNDSWFGRSNVAAMHLALAKFRAVEHRRYLVSASNSGVSAFIDPIGRSAGETPVLEAATRIGTIHWLHGRTLYERTGDLFGWLAAGSLVLGQLVRCLRVASCRTTAEVLPAPSIRGVDPSV